MTSTKAALISALSRTDSPRRETLRRELARSKPTGRRAGLKPKLVLASASPRRLTLLGQVGIEPDALRPSSIDEQPFKGEMPRSLVTRLARSKAESARDQIANDKDIADAYVLAADTVVAVGTAHPGEAALRRGGARHPAAALRAQPPRAHGALPDHPRRSPAPQDHRHARALQAAGARRRSRPTSPRASGAARPAATPSRASPAASCRRWSAPTPTSSACR